MHNLQSEPNVFVRPQSRRQFLRAASSGTAIACLSLAANQLVGATPTPKYRAAIIGHTGCGDYGHNLDMIFAHRKDVKVVAVADPVAEGRAQVAARCGAARQYADYREMLSVERPNLVSIAPRWTDQHHAMALESLHAGAHVFMEKPITRTLAEADNLLSVANQNGLRIAVAHQMKLAPGIASLKERLATGFIGDLLEIHAHGKQDRRAGGEDMIVLGVHLFDLMRYFAGDPEWCTARILERDQPITRDSGRSATEDIGPVAGDELFGQFALPSGVNATFTSRGRRRQVSGPWGMELIGSTGIVRILADAHPRIFLRDDTAWTAEGRTSQWRPLEVRASLHQSELGRSTLLPNQRLVNDWLEAIDQGRDPVSSGRAGMQALEMALALFEAAVREERVKFPLANRDHPLSKSS